MKTIVVVLVIAYSILLVGCSTPQPTVPLSESDKRSISEGKLVKFTDIRPATGNLQLDKATLPNGVFVCASAWAFPTPNCYPYLSKLVGQHLSARGIPIARDQASSDATLYFNAAFWYEGHMPDPNFSYNLDTWLAKGGALDNTQKKSTSLETGGIYLAGKALQIGGTAMFGALMSSGGGYYTNRHWVSISMVKIDTKTSVQINNAPWNTDTSAVHQFDFAGRYVGPVKVNDSALPLFDQAMKETLDQVVVKEIKSSSAVIQK